jgi:hypothetical protein
MANPIQAVYRRFTAQRSGKAQLDLRATGLESLAVDQVALPGQEMTRAGRRMYIGNNGAITGIAPVQVLPTTTPQWAFYNADPWKTFFLEALGMYCTSGTPGVGGQLMVCLFLQNPAAVGASTAGIGTSSGSGAGIASGQNIILVKSAPGAITNPAAPNWIQVAENISPNVGAFPGSAYMINRGIAGRIAIQPGFGLGLAVVAPAGTTPLFAPMAEGILAESDME